MNVFGFEIPISFGGGLSHFTIYFLVILIFVSIITAVILYWMFQKKVYNKKVVIYENIAGTGWRRTKTDLARTIKIGDGGEELLWLKKHKVYRTAYGRKMGINEYWFAIGQDGYWYNFVLGDLDAKMGMLDIEPVDRDMRMMHVAVRKNIQDRYKKQNFMEKYGTIIVNGIFLVIIGIMLWFLVDQIGGIASAISSAVDNSAQLQESSKQIVTSLDNICTGGSGIVAA